MVVNWHKGRTWIKLGNSIVYFILQSKIINIKILELNSYILSCAPFNSIYLLIGAHEVMYHSWLRFFSIKVRVNMYAKSRLYYWFFMLIIWDRRIKYVRELSSLIQVLSTKYFFFTTGYFLLHYHLFQAFLISKAYTLYMKKHTFLFMCSLRHRWARWG